jgi:septal ring factor EnvC (AmiA/AmiB activator)
VGVSHGPLAGTLTTLAVSEARDTPEALKNIGALEAAEERAFQRGQSSAKLRSQVESHERRLDAINGSIDRHARAQEQTNDRLDELSANVRESTAVAKARADVAAELAKRAASNTVDKRTFLISLTVATMAVASVLIGALALIGHA